jgi:hypothetical protein
MLWFLALHWVNAHGTEAFFPPHLSSRDKQDLIVSLFLGVLSSLRYTLSIKESKGSSRAVTIQPQAIRFLFIGNVLK